jgi:hypothetical protein
MTTGFISSPEGLHLFPSSIITYIGVFSGLLVVYTWKDFLKAIRSYRLKK